MARARRLLGTFLLVTALLPGTASAHEFSERFTAPLPLELLFGGAAATVGLTAVVLAVAVSEVPAESSSRTVATIPPSVATFVRRTSRSLFFLAFVLTVGIGLLGKQAQAENFATVFLWPVWLKGLVLVAAVVGSPWRVLSPWRALYDGLARLEGEPIAILGSYPSWLGVWPALTGFVVWIGVVENLTVIPRSPRLTALFLTVYALAMLGGGLAFGPRWFRQGDALAVLYRLFGRVAPVTVERTESGQYRIALRWPWLDCRRPVAGVGAAVFVVATVYTVSFDGFVSTPEYQTLLFGARDALGIGSGASVLLYLLGFVGFVVVFLGVATLTQHLAGARASEWRSAVWAFAPTLLPIAVAYEVAHNYPYVLANAGRLPAVLWAFAGFGHGPSVSPLAWLSVGAFWWSQVLLVVAGHVVAVVAAHYVTVDRYPTSAAARRGHLPLTVLMIGYTVLSLWIVSRPIVT